MDKPFVKQIRIPFPLSRTNLYFTLILVFLNWAFFRHCIPMSRQMETKPDARKQHSETNSALRGLHTSLDHGLACWEGGIFQDGNLQAQRRFTSIWNMCCSWPFLWAPVLVFSHPLDILILTFCRCQHIIPKLLIFPQTSFLTFPSCFH